MQRADKLPITVFGGMGFLGRRVVYRLARRNHPVRVAVRHPRRDVFTALGARVEQVRADVSIASTVTAAIAGAGGVITAVGLYMVTRGLGFDAVHVDGAERVACSACAPARGWVVSIYGFISRGGNNVFSDCYPPSGSVSSYVAYRQ